MFSSVVRLYVGIHYGDNLSIVLVGFRSEYLIRTTVIVSWTVGYITAVIVTVRLFVVRYNVCGHEVGRRYTSSLILLV